MPAPIPYIGTNCGPDCPICNGTESEWTTTAATSIARDIEEDVFNGRTMVDSSGTEVVPSMGATYPAIIHDPITGLYIRQENLVSVTLQPPTPAPQCINAVQWMGDLVANFRNE